MKRHLDVALRSLCKAGEELCGDKAEMVSGEGWELFVLSDGLGSGVKANILSTLTTKIIATMLKEGADIDETVETIAATLPLCKVRGLAYSTFSILQLYQNGTARLVEFDNPACVFVRGGRLVELPFTEREIAEKRVRECTFDIKIGDTFALMSDGIMHAGIGALLNLGWGWKNAAAFVVEAEGKAQSAARTVASLLQVVDNMYLSQPGDDCTALLVRIVERKPVHLLAGPSVDRQKDVRQVGDWLAGEGAKVISGGTTANIAARELGRALTTSLENMDERVPPIGYMEGVDLVTEGILTLSRTLEILKSCYQDGVEQSYESFRALDKPNGAAKLARLLLENCTELYCYVGGAINPAHQNPSLPMDLSIKMHLINQLKQQMTQMGRRVEIRYY